MTEAEALKPTVEPDVPSLLAEFDWGIGNVVRTVDVGTLSGSVPQPTPVVPADAFAAEQVVRPALAPGTVPAAGWLDALVLVAGAALVGTAVLAGVPLNVVAPFVVVLSGVEVTVGPV